MANGFPAAVLLLAAAYGGDASGGAPSGVTIATTCSAEAQARFDQGLFLLHSMMYTEARTEFAAAAKADDRCAMPQWGIAMTWFQPLWSGQPTPQALQTGSDAIEKAKSLAVSERDRAYVMAAAGYYREWPATGTPIRLRNWEASQRELAVRYPGDVEAQAFWALSRLAAADKYDRTYAQQQSAAQALEKLLEQRPEHPGLMHYLIHAYDNPAHAHDATHLAKAYEGVAPNAPHALHMPSHIYVRLGAWPQVVEWNIKSAATAKAQPAEGDRVSRDYLHALDYMAYGYLQMGDDRSAKGVLEQIDPKVLYQLSFGPAAYALAAVPARLALERGEWKQAAGLRARWVDYNWDQFPWAEAVTYAARGLGAARTGDTKAANEAITELERLSARVDLPWWKDRVAIDRDVILAWLAYDRQDTKQAVDLLSAAATREIAAGKDPAEPGHVICAIEQLGFLLLELKRPQEALAAFEASLKDSPKRFNSLSGAARAAQAAKLTEKARSYYSELVEISAPDTDRQAYKDAKAYLSSSRASAALALPGH